MNKTNCWYLTCLLAAYVVVGFAQEGIFGESAPASLATTQAAEEWPDLTAEVDRLNKYGPKTKAERDRMSYIQQEVMLRSEAAAHGDFHITGKVADEDGNPLKGVTLEIERIKPPSLSDLKKVSINEELQKKYTQREVVTIDGKFEVRAEDYAKLHITFTKDGYEKISRYFTADVTVDQMRRLLRKNATVSKCRPVKEDITIELEKVFVLEKEAKLKRGRATFEPRSDGSVIMLDLGRKYEKDFMIAQAELPALPSTDKMTPNQIWLTAPIDEAKGVFKTIPVTIEQQETRYIAGQTLHISGKDAGFILYQPKRLYRAWREMGEAPKEGYKNELEITPELAIRYHASGGEMQNGIYFYIRTADGKYGKGQISGGWKKGEKCKQLRIIVVVFLQPDGTRNLQTRE